MSDDELVDEAKSNKGGIQSSSKNRQGQEHVSIATTSDIYRVGIRVPPFWPEEPEIWFAQVEGQFAISNITADSTKFFYVISNLDSQYSKEVKDIITNPPQKDKYDKLKYELIKRLSASREKKVHQLLMHEELGNRKPSQFLRHLQSLAGPSVPDDFLRTIWSSRLPSNIQTLIASQQDSTLEALADLADRVQDIVAPTLQVAATAIPGPSMQSMSLEIAELKEAVKKLTLQLNRQSRPRNRFNDSQRQRSTSRSASSYRKHPLCWFHSKFGHKANKCIKPCDFKSSGNAPGGR